MKKIAAAILLLATLGFGQTVRHFPAKETNNIFTGTNQFNVGARVGPVTFANLPTGTIDGTVIYVSDGSVTNPCTGGGTGAFAYRVLGAWNCSAATVSSGVGTGATNQVADRKSTRLNSSHEWISYAVFCLKKKKQQD